MSGIKKNQNLGLNKNLQESQDKSQVCTTSKDGKKQLEWKSSLPRYSISRKTYEAILDKFSYFCRKVKTSENIYDYFKGYKNYDKIYFNNEYLICPEYMLHWIDKSFTNSSHKQCICRLDDSVNVVKYVKAKSGLDYYNDLFNKNIKKIYNNYEEIFESYTTEYDSSKSQLHYFIQTEYNAIYKYDNAYYYDLNGAYCTILCDIFPKAKDLLVKLYNKKYKNPSYKNLYCFAVGYLVRKGYTGLYNYIVQRVRAIIDKYISLCNGTLLYANTDGFIVNDPAFHLETSNELGHWKCEYEGVVYVYRQDIIGSTPYDVIQYGDKVKGTARAIAHEFIDLSKNKVATYNIERDYLNWDQYGNYQVPKIDDNWITKTTNVKGVKLNGKKI